MALGDYSTDDFRKHPEFTHRVLRLEVPQMVAHAKYWLTDVAARTSQSASDSFPYVPIVLDWGKYSYESFWMNEQIDSGGVVMMLSNIEIPREFASVWETVITTAYGTLLDPAKEGAKHWPRWSDVFLSVIAGYGMWVALVLRGGGSERVIANLEILDIFDVTPQTFKLALARPRDWNETIPRHFTEDLTKGVGPTSGIPINSHYGQWGNSEILASAPPIDQIAFTPWGRNTTSQKRGGFNSPIPLTPRRELGLSQAGRGVREWTVSRYFDSFITVLNPVWHSIYVLADSSLARLAPGPSGVLQGLGDFTADRPHREQVVRMNEEGKADFMLLPDKLGGGFNLETEPDPFSNMVDGRAETFVEGHVPIGAVRTVDFELDGGTNKGLVTGVRMVADVFTDSHPNPGLDHDGSIVMNIAYGENQVGVPIVWGSGAPIALPKLYPTWAPIVADAGIVNDPTLNGIFKWDFSYDTRDGAGDIDGRDNVTCGFIFSGLGSANNLSVFIRNLYLIVTYLPWNRLIDKDAILERPELLGPDAQGRANPDAHNELRVFMKPLRNYKPNVFADSYGILDWDPTTAPYRHNYRKSGAFSSDPVENQVRIMSHMVDSFGVARFTDQLELEQRTIPQMMWAMPSGQQLADASIAADHLDAVVGQFFGGYDDQHRTHWLIDREQTIIANCYRLALEAGVVLESYAELENAGEGNLYPPQEVTREVLGVWSPKPETNGSFHFGTPAVEDWWKSTPGEALVADEVAGVHVGLTSFDRVVNAVRIDYAFDHVSNKYQRNLICNRKTFSDFQPFTDPQSDTQADYDRALCAQSATFYGRVFEKNIQLQSVYRYPEAAALRSMVIQSRYRRRVLLNLRLYPGAADLATIGKCFKVPPNLFEVVRMWHPTVVRNLVEFSGSYNPKNWFDQIDYWRVVRYEWENGHPPMVNVWAVEGI